MSPRSYQMGRRLASRNETRARILEAVRQSLSDESSTELSMEAVARRADVSRLTIYYHFGSRAGLLEALYDYLATRGNMERMAEVFQESNLSTAVSKMVSTFVGFWSADPAVMRRLRAMAHLDAEIGKGIRARDNRRPRIAREILKRSADHSRRKDAQIEAADVLGMLTSFETYDALSRTGRTRDEIVATLTRLAQCVTSQILTSSTESSPRR